jgi:integrase
VERLIGRARQVGRHGDCDATLILLMYRQGLHVAEASRLRWEHIDGHAALPHVWRLKHGGSSVYPLHGPELLALRRARLFVTPVRQS